MWSVSRRAVHFLTPAFWLPLYWITLHAVTALYSSSLDLAAVGALLSEILTAAEREEVLVMLLQVIAADGRQGGDELEALDQVAAALSVTSEEKHVAFSRYFDKGKSETAGRRIHLSRVSAL